MDKNIILIGMPGTYKSSAGKLAAKKADMLFYDSDALFTERFGSVSEFFARYGEDLFRIEEGKILYELSLKKGAVIATGGGAVLNPVCMGALKKSGTVIELTATDETLMQRLSEDKSRPLIKGDTQKSIAALRLARADLYLRYADKRVCTDNLTSAAVADLICKTI